MPSSPENMAHYEDLLEDLLNEMLQMDANAMLRIERVMHKVRVDQSVEGFLQNDIPAKH